MLQTDRAQEFEQALLAHVKLCYTVASGLTGNAADARRLTREVLSRAWRLRAELWTDREPAIKAYLLSAVREQYLREYRHVGTAAAPEIEVRVDWGGASPRAEAKPDMGPRGGMGHVGKRRGMESAMPSWN